MDDRLYRSRTDRSLAGVCGGVAAWLGLDPSLVRVVWVLLALMSGGVFLILYIVMAIVVPDAPPGWAPRGRWRDAGPAGPAGPGGAPGTAWTGQPPSDQWQGGTWAQPPSGGAAPGGAWTSSNGGWTAGPGAPDGPPPPGPASWPEDWGRPSPSASRRRPEEAGVIAGIVLILLGVWFLVGAYIPVNWALVWPVAVIALGAILIAGAARGRR